ASARKSSSSWCARGVQPLPANHFKNGSGRRAAASFSTARRGSTVTCAQVARCGTNTKEILEQNRISGWQETSATPFPRTTSAYVGSMRASDLLHPRPEGLYCPPGDFFIDPVRPVERALITHGHSDHARAGHGSVL